ncbi:MAG TPA: M17 family peptidase N-terminal domain-containing protein, partial [Steroidobacteraceae bacterium]|nr:M17 family peptidase N-terminal domain-containing protein [Steroidobacteraceae bacterium]
MRFEIWSKAIATLDVDCLVVGVFEEGQLTGEARDLDSACGGRLRKLLARGDFQGKAAETLLIADLPGIGATRVLLAGLGPRKSFGRKIWRKAWTAAVVALSKTAVKSVALALARPDAKELDDYYFGRAVAQIAREALYRINDLKSGKKPGPAPLERVLAGPVVKSAAAAVNRGLTHGAAIADACKAHRDLANLPGNICTPTFLAEETRALAKRHRSLRVRVLDEPAIRREKMGCLLAVAQGSAQPPRFIVIEHAGSGKSRSAPPVVLVGKGVTFDTGG